ncbi:putative Homeobox-like domain superfamily, protein LIN-9/Protein ALWAYS EARLY [Helianthus anomalus]
MGSCMFHVFSYHQKRKLSHMLGSPWTDKKVERFYKAYMKCEKDWKKVCAFFVFFFVVKILF